MNTLTISSLTACALFAFVPTAASQDILNYKLDANCSLEAINFAVGSTVGSGTFTTGLPSPWTNGQFNSGMSGADKINGINNVLDTGWATTAYAGDFSVAFWVRNRPGNSTTIAFGYPYGAVGGNFRCFTGASGRMFFSGFPSTTVSNNTDISALLNAGYVHVALTVDVAALSATIYINGVPDPAVALPAAPMITHTGFVLGARDATGASSSPLDIDEFLLTTSLLTPAEITFLAASPKAGVGPFGSDCGPQLVGNGLAPTLGSTSFGVSTTGTPIGLAWFVLGTSRCSLGGGAAPLPIPLGSFFPSLAGCLGHVDTDLGSFGPLPIVLGSASLSIPIPATPMLAGLTAYAQGFTLDGIGQLKATNGVGIGVGY